MQWFSGSNPCFFSLFSPEIDNNITVAMAMQFLYKLFTKLKYLWISLLVKSFKGQCFAYKMISMEWFLDFLLINYKYKANIAGSIVKTKNGRNNFKTLVLWKFKYSRCTCYNFALSSLLSTSVICTSHTNIIRNVHRLQLH